MTIFLTKAEYAALTGEAAKGSKYGNERVTTEDGTFDSLGEHRRWEELRLRERAGEIANLKRQVAFALIVGDVKVATYIADFTYDEGGVPITEDFKGVRTEGYKIKAKLMLACHGIAIRETGREPRRKRR